LSLQVHAGDALVGVGDASLGEWHEWTGYAYHIRRRLSLEEAVLIGPVEDIRGTPDARHRAERVRKYIQRAGGRMAEAVWLEEVGTPL
jgi:hypothetical protein